MINAVALVYDKKGILVKEFYTEVENKYIRIYEDIILNRLKNFVKVHDDEEVYCFMKLKEGE